MISFLFAKHFPTSLDRAPAKFKRRVIMDREGGSPYLARFYLTHPPTMPDGSEPFDAGGNPREGVRWRDKSAPLSAYVHYFYRGDDDGALHNHPWQWAVSLVLSGGYSEERRVGDRVERRAVRPLSLNVLRSGDFHRVDLLEPERGCWSIFVVGPRFQDWGFWDRVSKKFTPWREFIDNLRGRA